MVKNLVTDEVKAFSDQVFFHYCNLNIVIFINIFRTLGGKTLADTHWCLNFQEVFFI